MLGTFKSVRHFGSLSCAQLKDKAEIIYGFSLSLEDKDFGWGSWMPKECFCQTPFLTSVFLVCFATDFFKHKISHEANRKTKTKKN